MTKHCRNCVYHMSGNPPVCNAMHTPTYDPIECVDWEASETFKTYSGERLDQGQIPIALRIDRGEAMMFGYEIQESIEARRAAIARDTQRRADEAIARNTHPPIALSELRTAIRGIRNPTRSGERWHVALPDEPMLSYSIGLKPLPTSPSFRQITLTAIATSSGLKWQYQGAVIID